MIFGQEIIATCCGAFRILWKFMHEPTCMEVFEQDPGLLQDQSYTTSACSIAPIRRRTFGHAGSKHALKFHPTNFKIFASTETAFEKQYKSFSNNHFKETVFMKSHHPTVSQNHGGSPKTCFFFLKSFRCLAQNIPTSSKGMTRRPRTLSNSLKSWCRRLSSR